MIDIAYELNQVGLKVNTVHQTGKWIRVATVDKPNKRNGSYICGTKTCFWHNWATNENGWFFVDKSYNKPITDDEKAYYAKQRAEAEELQQRFKEQDRQHRLVIIDKAYHAVQKRANTHAYLERKQSIMMPDFKIDFQNRVIIPMYNVITQLTGYQYIDDEGNKKFKTGTIHKGSFYPIMAQACSIRDLDLIFIVEGYCTGSAVYQALNEVYDAINFGVFCAFSAGNIDAVANSIYSTIGRKSIIAIKDNDLAGLAVKTLGFAVHYNAGGDANDIFCEFGAKALADLICDNMSCLKSSLEPQKSA